MGQITTALMSVLLVAGGDTLPMPQRSADEIKQLLLMRNVTPDESKVLAKAEIVFTATLAKVTEGAVANSLPPIRYYTLEFTNVKMTRGQVPAEAHWVYGVRSMEPLEFDASVCTVAARMVGGEPRIELLLPPPRAPKFTSDVIRRALESFRRDRDRQIVPQQQ